MKKPHNPMELDRTQLVDALRAVTPTRKYQDLTHMSTATLRAALAYYQTPEEDREPQGVLVAGIIIERV